MKISNETVAAYVSENFAPPQTDREFRLMLRIARARLEKQFKNKSK